MLHFLDNHLLEVLEVAEVRGVRYGARQLSQLVVAVDELLQTRVAHDQFGDRGI